MTPDEAIERLQQFLNSEEVGDIKTLDRAMLLGIEALNEVKRLRSYKAFHVVNLLPGETEEKGGDLWQKNLKLS